MADEKAICLGNLSVFKENIDDEIAEVEGKIPVIPEALPANGGNAETAKKLLPIVNIQNQTHGHSYTKLLEFPLSGHVKYTYTFSYQEGNIDGASNDYGIINVRIDINSSDNRFYKCVVNELLDGNVDKNIFFLCISEGQASLFVEWKSTWNYVTLSHINGFGSEYKIPDSLEFLTAIPDGFSRQDAVYLNNEKEISDLKAYIGYTDSDIYGLEADFENNRFTRLAGAVGKNPGADFNSVNAFGGRRRCAVANNGQVKAYYGDANFSIAEDGYYDTDGVQTQIMVEQPKFYYKVVPLKTEKIDSTNGYHLRKARYYISDNPKPGFKIHPAFIQNGIEVDKIYLSAYEGGIYDFSEGGNGRLLNDEQIADFDTDLLCSTINVKPASGTTQALTRDNARKLAQNRGAGWGITTIQTLSATQLLFAIEYAAFNSQAAIGNGVVNAAETIRTGSTSSLGNASGSVESGGVSYRGEENLWGNINTFIDGYDPIGDSTHIISTISSNDKIKMYSLKKNGYISSFNYNPDLDWCFIPCDKNGNSSLPVGDTAYGQTTTIGKIVPVFGGDWSRDSSNGLFSLYTVWEYANYKNTNGARLIYIPTEVTAND